MNVICISCGLFQFNMPMSTTKLEEIKWNCRLADGESTRKAEDAGCCYGNGSGRVDVDEGERSERRCHRVVIGSSLTEQRIGHVDVVHGDDGVFGRHNFGLFHGQTSLAQDVGWHHFAGQSANGFECNDELIRGEVEVLVNRSQRRWCLVFDGWLTVGFRMIRGHSRWSRLFLRTWWHFYVGDIVESLVFWRPLPLQIQI